jgi:hypothetical protein
MGQLIYIEDDFDDDYQGERLQRAFLIIVIPLLSVFLLWLLFKCFSTRRREYVEVDRRPLRVVNNNSEYDHEED